MTRITVVIEDHGEGIHLGQQLAGGRVIAAMQGDHSWLLESLDVLVSAMDASRVPAGGWTVALANARAAIANARGQ